MRLVEKKKKKEEDLEKDEKAAAVAVSHHRKVGVHSVLENYIKEAINKYTKAPETTKKGSGVTVVRKLPGNNYMKYTKAPSTTTGAQGSDYGKPMKKAGIDFKKAPKVTKGAQGNDIREDNINEISDRIKKNYLNKIGKDERQSRAVGSGVYWGGKPDAKKTHERHMKTAKKIFDKGKFNNLYDKKDVNEETILEMTDTKIRQYIGKALSSKKNRTKGVNLGADKIEKKAKVPATLAEAKAYKPIPDHPYHSKSNAELHYILKDAGQAARNMRGHDDKAEGKYLDQVNDASTVLHYRQKHGKDKDEPKKLNEEGTELLRQLQHVVTRHDRAEEQKHLKNKRYYYNHYALGHLLSGVEKVHQDITSGMKPADAINNNFVGSVARKLHTHLKTGDTDTDTKRRKLFKNAGSSLDESLKLIKKYEVGPHAAKVYKDTDYNEHRVKFFTDGKHHTEADYHTNDVEDAHETASSWLNKKEDDRGGFVNRKITFKKKV